MWSFFFFFSFLSFFQLKILIVVLNNHRSCCLRQPFFPILTPKKKFLFLVDFCNSNISITDFKTFKTMIKVLNYSFFNICFAPSNHRLSEKCCYLQLNTLPHRSDHWTKSRSSESKRSHRLPLLTPYNFFSVFFLFHFRPYIYILVSLDTSATPININIYFSYNNFFKYHQWCRYVRWHQLKIFFFWLPPMTPIKKNIFSTWHTDTTWHNGGTIFFLNKSMFRLLWGGGIINVLSGTDNYYKFQVIFVYNFSFELFKKKPSLDVQQLSPNLGRPQYYSTSNYSISPPSPPHKYHYITQPLCSSQRVGNPLWWWCWKMPSHSLAPRIHILYNW